MPKVGAYALIGVLTTCVFAPAPSLAFGLRLGPIGLPLPFFGHRGGMRVRHHTALRTSSGPHHALYDSASLGNRESPQEGVSPALIYPNLALSSIYDDVFWPARTSQWAFGYDAIFHTAFGKSRQAEDARACQRPNPATNVVSRIAAEIRPNAEQKALLQKLGQALAMASGALSRACPGELPPQPVARLQLIETQLQALTLAIDLVRPPLEALTQSLNAKQLARLAPDGSKSVNPSSCSATPSIGWSIDEINRAVQVNDSEQNAVTDLRSEFAAAADDINAHCAASPTGTPVERLEAIEARLDASWRAVLTMQVALNRFEASLTDQQRNRFSQTDVAAAP
jgi:hypothetical protein